MDNIVCPSCGGQKATQINEQEYRCEYCGHTFRPTIPRPVCNPQQSSSQPNYQQPYQPQPVFQQPSQSQPAFNPVSESETTGGKSRIAAAILAIVIGGLGIHHFYLGNTGRGILYLLFCWTYIPSIIGLVEGIIYLTQSDEEFASKY